MHNPSQSKHSRTAIQTRQNGRSDTRLLMQRMEALEDVPASHHQTLSGSIRWMVPYADLVTILLGLFLVLYAMQSKDLAMAKQEAPIKTKVSQPLTLGQAQQNEQKGLQKALIEDQKRHITLLEEELNLEEAEKERAKLDETMGGEATGGEATNEPKPLNFLMEEVSNSEVSKSENLKEKATLSLSEQLQELTHQNTGEKNGITVQQEERGIVISLKDKILFSAGDAHLTPQAKQTLSQIGITLKKLSHSIRVEGHSDNTPIKTLQYPSNWELSTARATEIVKYLSHQHKISATRLSAVGYGEFKPIANNSTIEGKQKNRRVDIVILNEVSRTISEAEQQKIVNRK